MTWKVKYLSFLGGFTRRTERMISKLSQNFFINHPLWAELQTYRFGEISRNDNGIRLLNLSIILG